MNEIAQKTYDLLMEGPVWFKYADAQRCIMGAVGRVYHGYEDTTYSSAVAGLLGLTKEKAHDLLINGFRTPDSEFGEDDLFDDGFRSGNDDGEPLAAADCARRAAAALKAFCDDAEQPGLVAWCGAVRA